ncbi:MAG: hypothetical protein IH798_03735 [Gemmatimonadetes bacterium]|nr:hypothetical protein [Gemmatimonadota bacterium]
MPDINRRGFVGSVAASVPIAAASRHLLRSGKSAPLDDALIGALGHSLLPTELGSDNIDRVVDEFQQWLELYSTDAELNHGYGTSEIDYTPGDPTSRWQDQLDGLNAEAQRRFGASFVDLDADVRRGIIRQQIADDRLDRLPRAYRARHVAVGLLAYFYASPEATDLCYKAAIGKNKCRPLRRSPDEPISLRPGG